MLRYLINWLASNWNFPGGNLINYLSVQGILSGIISLVLTMFIGKYFIQLLRKKQVSDEVRELGLTGNDLKKKVPTMGGIIIIIALSVSILLLGDIKNTSIQVLLVCILWFGLIGFVDDYIKVFKKKKAGLAGKYKVAGQFLYAVLLAFVLLNNNDLSVQRQYVNITNSPQEGLKQKLVNGVQRDYIEVQAYITTIPFVKKHEFNYQKLVPTGMEALSFLVYVFIIAFIIISTSNAANLTDGIDGSLTGIVAIVGFGLSIFAYVSSNINLADYLNILYIPYGSEIFIVCLALIGACVGFLWFNAFPAQVFMGDTGSLCLGGIVATKAILIRKELLIPIFCGVFFLEAFSVSLQVFYFKYTKRKYGVGKRIFLMSPIHHHYQKKGMHENKVVIRFWIISIILILLSIFTLKIR